MPPLDVVRSLAGAGDPAVDFIVLELRLPRVLTALLAGAALGMAGAVFQQVARNPLVAPDIVGVSGGAALAAVAVIVLRRARPAAAGGARRRAGQRRAAVRARVAARRLRPAASCWSGSAWRRSRRRASATC